MPTEDELEALLVQVSTAISNLLLGGASYTIDTGGSRRQFTSADLGELRSMRSALYQELKEIKGEAGLTLGAGW